MNERLARGLPAAAEVRASAPARRAWVIVHPIDGGARYRATWIELDAKLADTDVDLDRALLARDESSLCSTLDEVRVLLARAGGSLESLGDPRDCACPI